MNNSLVIIYLILVLCIVYILYLNNIYLSYKIYNNDKFNDYDKIMLKITSVSQSLIFIYFILFCIYNYKKNINTYKYLTNYLGLNYNYNLIVIFLIMLYYGHSLYINYIIFNNNHKLNNKNLKYHIYSSIPLLLLVILVLYK